MTMTFHNLVAHVGYPLEHAALLMAKEIAYPHLDVRLYTHRLDEISNVVQARVHPKDKPLDIIKRLNQYLFEEQGFQGNTQNYYDPRNSFLNDVINRHTGIPISLSVLYMALAKRLGVSFFGVGLPGHFIIGSPIDGFTVYVDPFHEGLILSEEECLRIASHYMPHERGVSKDVLYPQSHRQVLMRMLNNLRQIYLSQADTEHLLPVLCLQAALMPENVELQRDIGALAVQQGQWGRAVRMLRGYYYNHPHAEDIDNVSALLDKALTELSRLN